MHQPFRPKTPAHGPEGEAPRGGDYLTSMSHLEKALKIALKAHKGQKDKAGAPYILHPLHVMMQMNDEISRIAAVLHDVVEDTDLTLEDLGREGFSSEVLEIVDSLTWRPDENYENYISRLKQNPAALKIKIADLEHNMDLRRIPHPAQKDFDRVKKYHGAWKELSRYGAE